MKRRFGFLSSQTFTERALLVCFNTLASFLLSELLGDKNSVERLIQILCFTNLEEKAFVERTPDLIHECRKGEGGNKFGSL